MRKRDRTMVCQQLLVLFTLIMLQQSSKAMTPDITLKGTKITNESINIYQFICETNVRFWGCNIELFGTNSINVKLRLSEKTCYNRYDTCEPEICSCSDGCNEFKWNLTTHDHLDNTSIECEGRLQKNDLYFKANVHIMVNRHGFINLGSTVNPINDDLMSVIISSTSSTYLAKESSYDQTIQIAILCFVSLIPIVLILFILRWFYRRITELKGNSLNKWKSICCPWNLRRSPAINKNTKKRVPVKKLEININPNKKKQTTQQHNIGSFGTTEVNIKPNGRKKTPQLKPSNAEKPTININLNDIIVRQHAIPQLFGTDKTTIISTTPDEIRKTIKPYINTCSSSSGSNDGNTSVDNLIRTNSIYV